jgi:hypothetical protein
MIPLYFSFELARDQRRIKACPLSFSGGSSVICDRNLSSCRQCDSALQCLSNTGTNSAASYLLLF